MDGIVNFYTQVIFPRICDLLLNRRSVDRLRRDLLANATGDVLEIGFGTGLNLPFYLESVRKITTVDPNVGMNAIAKRRIKKSGIEVDQKILSGERLPFNGDTFDCVVSTFTLCSIDNIDQAILELYRVLKPRGLFLFLEHGLSPEPNIQKWQHRLNWLEMRLADGCRLDRDIRQIVEKPPFSSLRVDEFYMTDVPKTHGYMFRGVALK